MAAGTDIAHPGSAIEGGYKPHPLEPLPLCTIKENGAALDNSESAPPPEQHDQQQEQQQQQQQRQHHPQQQHPGAQAPPSRPPRPTTNSAADRPASAMRRAVSSSVIPSTPGLLDGDRENADPSLIEGVDMSFGGYMPEVRSGGWMDIGRRESMEDDHLRIDDLVEHAGSLLLSNEGPGAFYGVFDGHGGKEAASFVREHLLANILEDVAFPKSMGEALRNAFLQTDQALVDGAYYSSGTTALTAMVFGRTLLVANAGDCRAVLSKRGNAVNMSRDHKAGCSEERSRIEAAGGYVYDGYLNGQLNVARALGDWGIVGLKKVGVVGPLSAEPEVQQAILTEEDEFLIIGCDGLWDVFSSQNAVDFARRKLQEHNDPERCSRELIEQALERDTTDNLTVVTVCFSPNPPPKRAFSPTSMSKPTGWVPRFRRSLSAEGLRNVQDLLDSHGDP